MFNLNELQNMYNLVSYSLIVKIIKRPNFSRVSGFRYEICLFDLNELSVGK